MPVLANIYYTHHRGEVPSRPPVILIHGAGSNYLCWPAEIRRLRDVSVYAIDLPGHGKSTGTAHHRVTFYQSAIIEFIAQLGINCAVLVGHSLGAAIGLQLALDHPEHVAGLVCISGAASFQIDPTFINLFRIPQTGKTALELMKTYFAPQHGDQQWYPNLLKSLASIRNSLWYADLRASEQFDLRNHLSRINTPALVLSGTNDPMVSSSSASFLAHQLPNAELIRFYQHGHMLMLEDPQGVANHIRDFYQKIADSS
jgi:pimeloyl-ACP methyl ester carboxylesterase